MSKPTTPEAFSEIITSDRTWRMKEISDLKYLVRRADLTSRKVLLRALVTICYAHWEGYVKSSAKMYLGFIVLRKYQYSQLKRQFLKNAFLPRLNALSNSRVSLAEKCDLIDKILDSSNDRLVKIHPDLIYSDNLKTSAISEICTICDLDAKPFIEREDFIDIFLLKRRNSIAHGEETLIGIEDLDRLVDETMNLMRIFGDQLENKVALSEFVVA